MKSNRKPTYQELEEEISRLKSHSPAQKEKPVGKTTLVEDLDIAVLGNDQNFRLLFENMPNAFVYAKLIYEKNVPVDFEFIEVNKAFTELTGLENVVGKKESEVLPEVQQLDSEMFEIVGRVAKTGIAEQVEYYVNSLGKWFSAKIFSPQKGYFISVADDVTARKNVEESERYMSNIMNCIGDPIFVKDDQSRLLNVNDAFCQLFGLDRDDIIGKTLAEKVTPEERESFLKIDKQVLDHGVENINEESLTLRDGQTQRISTRKTRFVNSEGKKFLVGIIHDVTERDKSQQELNSAKEYVEEHEERFRILMLNMEAGVVIHAPDTSIVQNNKRASEILGLTTDQMKGKMAIDPDWKFVNPDKSPLPLAEYPVNRIASTKKSIKNQHAGIYQPDKDEIVWLTVNGFPVLNHTNGDIIEIVTVFIDITEQKKNEEEKLASKLKLEKTEKELNKAQNLAHVGSWIFDTSDNRLVWSEEMFHIWGFDPKKGTPSYDPDIISRIHPEDLELAKSSFNRAINQGIPYDIEFRVRIPNMEQKVVRSIFESTYDDAGEIVISGTNQDITLQKVFEEAQVKHQRLKAIGEMSSSIAHDFNNALQEMMGNLEVVKLQSGLSDTTHERLNDIRSIISDTAARVSALQKFGDPANDDTNAELIDLNVLIEESLKQSRPLWKDEMEKEGLRITVATDFKEIPKIRCNHGELKSVVFNLIKNSIEAMPEGGDLNIKTGMKGGRVFATFTDTGMGMDAEAKMKVFEPFFTTKGYKLGRGLGMSGAYSIVKKYKGDIAVKSSEKGRGTSIEMTFPNSNLDEVTVSGEQLLKAERSYRVLWVDDDFIITKSSSMMVQSIGHTCDAVNSGKKALEYLEKKSCDIVFTDIGMPKMNGWELADAIRSKFGDKIKIVAVTGWNIKEKVQEENAVDLFLQKPFTLEDLKKTLGEV